MAHAFSPKLAAKANFTYMRGTTGMRQTMMTRPMLEETGVMWIMMDKCLWWWSYDNIKGVAAGLLGAGAITQSQFAAFNSTSNYNVSRTGYNEVDQRTIRRVILR
jgi:hypothetical protein